MEYLNQYMLVGILASLFSAVAATWITLIVAQSVLKPPQPIVTFVRQDLEPTVDAGPAEPEKLNGRVVLGPAQRPLGLINRRRMPLQAEKSEIILKPEPEDGKRFKAVEEFWSYAKQDWEVREKRIADPNSDRYVFIVRTRYPASQKGEPMPTTLISVQSLPLATILRKVLRDNAQVFADTPDVDANETFLAQHKLKAEMELLNTASSDINSGKVVDMEEFKKLLEPRESRGPPSQEDLLAALSTTIDHLKVLFEWLEEAYAPTRSMLDRILPLQQVSYPLLWYLFPVGARCYKNHIGTNEKMGFVITSVSYQNSPREDPFFYIIGDHHIFNGAVWKRSQVIMRIHEFKGTRHIPDLPCVPMNPIIEAALTERGKFARKYAGVHYMHYEGILVQVFQTDTGTKVVKLRAEGRVMVDVLAYRRLNPNRDDIGDASVESPNSEMFMDLRGRWRIARRGNDQNQEVGEAESLSDDQLWLCPPTLHGFSFALKEWGELRVDQFSDIVFDEKAFDYLVVEPSQKRLIKGIVDATRASSNKHIVKDIISNKGSGAIFCLHGNAGCGKTLTAEAVAEMLKRPLYTVGSGELGTDAEGVESTLKSTLELCAGWDAVMLIDEADVYLEERGLHELQRNALVSIFLRCLDYHSGVLFLTTNRVKSFDPAFISRFNVAIKYPDLSHTSRFEIWTRFLSLAGVPIHDESKKSLVNGITNGLLAATPGHSNSGTSTPVSDASGDSKEFKTPEVMTVKQVKELADKPMNGRTIRNTVRTAQAIALSNNEALSFEHLKTVVDVSTSFLEDFKDMDSEGVYAAQGERLTDRSRLYF